MSWVIAYVEHGPSHAEYWDGEKFVDKGLRSTAKKFTERMDVEAEFNKIIALKLPGIKQQFIVRPKY